LFDVWRKRYRFLVLRIHSNQVRSGYHLLQQYLVWRPGGIDPYSC
jgi:hypothetical protein